MPIFLLIGACVGSLLGAVVGAMLGAGGGLDLPGAATPPFAARSWVWVSVGGVAGGGLGAIPGAALVLLKRQQRGGG